MTDDAQNPFPISKFHDWPATPDPQRLATALRTLQQAGIDNILRNGIPETGDPEMDADTTMALMSLLNTKVGEFLDLYEIMTAAAEDDPKAMVRQADGLDTPVAFPVIALTPPHESASPVQIFNLIRHPQWMGLSTRLPLLKGLDVFAWESPAHPHLPGYAAAVPPEALPSLPRTDRRPPDHAPQAQLFRTVALWHGAASFHWIPAYP